MMMAKKKMQLDNQIFLQKLEAKNLFFFQLQIILINYFNNSNTYFLFICDIVKKLYKKKLESCCDG